MQVCKLGENPAKYHYGDQSNADVRPKNGGSDSMAKFFFKKNDQNCLSAYKIFFICAVAWFWVLAKNSLVLVGGCFFIFYLYFILFYNLK